MKNRFLTILFGIIISLFFVNNCFALSSPYDLNTGTPGIGSVALGWCWGEGDETSLIGDPCDPEEIKYFELSWKKTGDDSNSWTLEWPRSELKEGESGPCNNDSYIYSYILTGLEEGMEYEWKLTAEACDGNYDSVNKDGLEFTTTTTSLGEEDWNDDESEYGSEGPITIRNLFQGIGNIQEAADAFMEFLSLTAFAVGPILIIYAGFLLLTKQGDPEAMTQAKKIILLTIIALSIVLFAKGIPSVVKDLFR